VTFPDGEDVEVFKFKALEKAWKEAKLSSEREHVTPYIKKNPDLFKIVNLENINDLSQKRWTLDEKNDYKFVKEVYARLYKKNHFFGMEEVLKLLDKHAELESINAQIKRNEGYIRSLKEDKVLNLNYLTK
jgi:spore coat polysaccharide biosynthesis protein SpsF